MVQASLVNAASVVLGPPSGAGGTVEGTWNIQVMGYAGLTGITPEVSVDGVTWFTGSVIPSNSTTPGTPVITIAANGLYYFDCGGAWARLTGVGVGSATIIASPATRG